ncbi:sterol O-acyltransferase 1-like [Coccinella septempunctata]|uniref:sterol O-acyltransferase 1-like n=1 Tax=Coccinella septempunctata TaxID=41139 RepID=UPI001D0644A3|nr:sterol O-acyltransferase 1-like [Coccinella septempunctata]
MTEQKENTQYASNTLTYNYDDKLKEGTGTVTKVFFHRESVLTFLFENPHIKVIRHIAIVVYLVTCFNSLMKRYLGNEGITADFQYIINNTRAFHIVIISWVFIYSLTCSTYFCFLAWARLRRLESNTKKMCDVSGIILLICFYISSFTFIRQVLTIFNIPMGTSLIIIAEQIRLLMKVHAFVRSNAPKVLQCNKIPNEMLVLPTFRYFVFFTWIPTLVYRDEYPRSTRIDWKRVTGYVLEILAAFYFYSFFLEGFSMPLFQDFGKRSFSRSELFLIFLQTILPAGAFLVVSFYLVQHLIPNLSAELSLFGDRMFYKDWWTATDVATYFRKWNLIVHDWLYAYVYKDCYETLFPGNKNMANLVTFFLSSIVHEWVVWNMLGYFMPIMSVMHFFLAANLTLIKFPQRALLNLLYWLFHGMGSAFLITLYSLEFYARSNGVPSTAGSYDFIIPRILTCDYCLLK